MAPRAESFTAMNAMKALLLSLFAAFLAVPIAGRSAPGDLDPTFDGDGMALASVRSEGEAYAIAIQDDGKIVVAGHSEFDFAVARFNTDGSIDTSFNVVGSVVTEVTASFNQANAVAIQDDGSIVLAGYSTDTDGQSTLVRHLPDGTRDPSFDTDGIKIHDFSGDHNDAFDDVALQSDGKIVAAGSLFDGTSHQMFLARFESDGDLDATTFGFFGANVDIYPEPARASAIAVRDDDRLLVGGSVGTPPVNFAIMGYLANGQVDVSFGDSGEVSTAVSSGEESIQDLAIQSDGKIVAAGHAYDTSGYADIALVRYLANGTLDTTFSGDGIVTTDIGGLNDLGLGLAIQPDGKIVVAGTTVVPGGRDFVILRYLPDGRLDPTFGGDGIVQTPIGDSPRSADAVAIQGDGKIVAGGTTGGLRFAIARYKVAQGDLRLGLRSTVKVGDNRFNLTGAGQRQSAGIRLGRKRSVFLGAQNESSVVDRILLQGTRGNARFGVKYLRGRTNVTGALLSGRYSTGPVAAGTISLLKAEITARTRRRGQRRTLSLTATSTTDAAAQDRALIQVRSIGR